MSGKIYHVHAMVYVADYGRHVQVNFSFMSAALRKSVGDKLRAMSEVANVTYTHEREHIPSSAAKTVRSIASQKGEKS